MDDMISRQAAIEALERFEKQCWEDMCFRPLMSDARVIIEGLPAAQPKQKTGRWENDKDCIPRCSRCGYIPEYNIHIDNYYYSNFCPNCGAKMEVQNDNM